MSQLEPKSSPGYPLMQLASTNAQLLESYSSLVAQLTVERLEAIESTSLGEVWNATAGELVSRGLVDEVRVFVKNELHSLQKIAQGRMRVIMSVSVIDQLVERVLNGPQNNLEIDSWQKIPSKPGMGLHDAGLRSLREQIEGMVAPLSTDITGFDWSVPSWALQLDARVRAQLAGGVLQENMFLVRAICLARSRLVFSDGVMWDQTIDGVQKSGSYNTSSTNSRIRVALGLLVARRGGWRPEIIAMGDDAVETVPLGEDVQPAYKMLGFNIKEQSRDIEFCAYAFKPEGYEPVRWHKMVATMLCVSHSSDASKQVAMAALKYELRHSPHLGRVLTALRAIGW